jgi:hypothetical protein
VIFLSVLFSGFKQCTKLHIQISHCPNKVSTINSQRVCYDDICYIYLAGILVGYFIIIVSQSNVLPV